MRIAETRTLQRRNPLETLTEMFLERVLPIGGLLTLVAVLTLAMRWLIRATLH
jgi:hypothetical protein